MAAFQPPGDCPVCGEYVPAGRKSCAHCGSDARSGWSEDTHYDGLDLPDESFEENLPARKNAAVRRRAAAFFWGLVGAVLLAVLIWNFVLK